MSTTPPPIDWAEISKKLTDSIRQFGFTLSMGGAMGNIVAGKHADARKLLDGMDDEQLRTVKDTATALVALADEVLFVRSDQ